MVPTAGQLQPKTKDNQGRSQYLWPATGSNSGFDPKTGKSNGNYVGKNPYVAPGALLAIPKALEKQVEVKTTIGKKIKDALINYGGYIVDGTGPGSDGHNMVAICMDSLINAEMRNQYKFNMAYPHGVTDGNPVYSDLLKIFRNLHAVSNNAPNSVGGGGVPLKPTKPPLCK